MFEKLGNPEERKFKQTASFCGILEFCSNYFHTWSPQKLINPIAYEGGGGEDFYPTPP